MMASASTASFLPTVALADCARSNIPSDPHTRGYLHHFTARRNDVVALHDPGYGFRLATSREGPSKMLSDADRKKAADILMNAEKTRQQATQLSVTWPTIAIEDSYAISTEVANRKIAAGAKLIGHKVGLTSKAMQRSSQIDEPDYGHLLDSMMIADGAKVPHDNFCLPRVEVELAFVLGKRLLGPGVGLTDVLRATEYVVPSLEIVDARLQDPRKIVDTVADNGAAAGIVIGGRPVGPLDVDL